MGLENRITVRITEKIDWSKPKERGPLTAKSPKRSVALHRESDIRSKLQLREKTVFAAATLPRVEVTNVIADAPSEKKSLLTVDELIEDILGGKKRIQWRNVPGEVLHELLVKVARERDLPPSMLNQSDFTEPLKLFGYEKSLKKLYDTTLNSKERKRKGQSIVPFILEQAGIPPPTFEDVAQVIAKSKPVSWERIPSTAVNELLTKVAREQDKPTYLLTNKDMRQEYDFLGGKGLMGLYHYGLRNAVAKDEGGVMGFLLDKANVTVNLEDIIQTKRMGKDIPWDRVKGDGLAELLNEATNIVGRPLFLWRQQDFEKRLPFLENISLEGLYEFAFKHKHEKKLIEYVHERAGLQVTNEDIVWAMELKLPFWGRVPKATKRRLLEAVAQECGYPPIMLTRKDLNKKRDFLAGHSLIGLYEHTAKEEKRKHPDAPRDTITALVNEAQVEVSVTDVITAMKADGMKWERVPANTLRAIMEMVAQEKGIPTFMINPGDLLNPLKCIEGKPLNGLYQFAVIHPERDKTEQSVIDFLLQRTEITITLEDVLQVLKNPKATAFSERIIHWDQVPNEIIRTLLEEVAREKEIPASMINTTDFMQPLRFLNNEVLVSLLRNAASNKKRVEQEYPIMSFLLDRAGIDHPRVEDIAAAVKKGRQIPWERIPSSTLNEILTRAAKERNEPIPTFMLELEDMKKSFDFLGGANIEGLYDNSIEQSRTTNKGPMEFLLDKAGITISMEDIIQAKRLDRKVHWKRIKGEGLGQLLTHAAKIIGKPFFLWRPADFKAQLPFFENSSLTELYLSAQREKGEIDVIAYIMERAQLEVSIQDVIWAMQLEDPFWEKVPKQTKRQLLELAAVSTGDRYPTIMLTQRDLSQKLDFLKGHSLKGLYEYTREKNPHLGRGRYALMTKLLNDAEVKVTLEDVITAFKAERIVWERLPQNALQSLFEKVAEERGVPVSMLSTPDFTSPLNFLDGKNLAALYNLSVTSAERKEADKSLIPFLLEKAGIDPPSADDVIAVIKKANQHGEQRIVFWNSIPRETIRELLVRVAKERGIPVSMLNSSDFKTPLQFLDGQTLYGVYAMSNMSEERMAKKQSIMPFLIEKVGIAQPTADDVITVLKKATQEEVGRRVYWNNIPNETIHELFVRVAKERGIPVSILNSSDLRTPLQFLNGGNLQGPYAYYLKSQQKRDPNETAISEFKKKLGLPHESGRKGFRKVKMQQIFDTFALPENPQVGDFMPWINTVSELYEKRYIDIQPEEVQNELFVFVSDYLRDTETFSQEAFLAAAHRHIEAFSSKETSHQYAKKSFDTPLADSDLKLGDVLADKSQPTSTKLVFSRDMEATLSKLSPLEKFVVISVAVDQRPFDAIADEINKEKATYGLTQDVDVDMVEEYMNEALAILRGGFAPTEEMDE